MTSRPSTTTRPKSMNLSGTMTGNVTLQCEVCNKKYDAKTSFGLHVCPKCVARGGAPEKKKAPVAKPNAVLCYVCGREFFPNSLGIHIPQCLKKRAIAQSKLPPEMRTVLVKPKSLDQNDIPIKGKSIDEQNQEAFEIYQASLVPCENCGRTFSSPDRLQIHLKSCRSDAPARAPPSRLAKEKPSLNSTGNATGNLNSSMTTTTTTTIIPKATKTIISPITERPTSKLNATRSSVTSLPSTATTSTSESGTVPKWKKDHEKLQAAMRAAKNPNAVMPSPVDDDLVQCPYCTRKFNESAAERHIPKCSTIQNRPKPPPSRNSLSLTSPLPSSLNKSSNSSPTNGRPKTVEFSRSLTTTSSPTLTSTSQVQIKSNNNRSSISIDLSSDTGGSSSGSSGGGLKSSSLKPFCGSCGVKYPSVTSKFCGSCGDRRD